MMWGMAPFTDLTAPGLFIFGYGSLVSSASVSRTLQRQVDARHMPLALLHGYARDWEIRVPIIFDDGIACNGQFLDISPQPDASVNGVLIPVSDQELAMLTRREAQYDAVEVGDRIQSAVAPAARVIAFRGRAEFRRDTPQVPSFRPRSYRSLVETAVRSRGADFLAQFHSLTKPAAVNEYQGGYRFADPAQEIAARPPAW